MFEIIHSDLKHRMRCASRRPNRRSPAQPGVCKDPQVIDVTERWRTSCDKPGGRPDIIKLGPTDFGTAPRRCRQFRSIQSTITRDKHHHELIPKPEYQRLDNLTHIAPERRRRLNRRLRLVRKGDYFDRETVALRGINHALDGS